jgi:KaiC/GvpD/RAD55 family RecA-like ATPase
MNLPIAIQKAVDLGLLEVSDGKIVGANLKAVETVTGVTRLVEKLQPTTILDKEDTLDQEAIVLCRILSSSSGVARELWSQLRTAFGIGHGQELPESLWSSLVFKAIGREIDMTFMGERTGKTISRDSLITGYESLAEKSSGGVSFSDFCSSITELSDKETMKSYGDEDIEWSTALDILKQKRVAALFRETLYTANQFLKTDPNLAKALEFLHEKTMEGIGMLSGSIGNQGQAIDLTQSIIGDPGAGRPNWADYIVNAKSQEKPVSTGVPAFDLDIEGGVAPPRPYMPRAGRLMVIAARTGVGKTCFGVHVASSLAKGGLTVGFVSAELEHRAIEARIIANLSKSLGEAPYHWKRTPDLGYVTVGELEMPGATNAQDRIAQIVTNVSMKLDGVSGKMLIEAPWGADVDACINTMRSMKAKSPELRAVVLDHFHALARHKGGSASNPSAMLEDRAYRLMTAAKELDIDLFVLAQLNRVGMDATSSAEPQLNEIRGTDALAHVSHATWLIRKIKTEDNVNRGLEVWHSKVRGRQALWEENEGILESIKGFHEKSIVMLDYETSSVASDTTISDVTLRNGKSY